MPKPRKKIKRPVSVQPGGSRDPETLAATKKSTITPTKRQLGLVASLAGAVALGAGGALSRGFGALPAIAGTFNTKPPAKKKRTVLPKPPRKVKHI